MPDVLVLCEGPTEREFCREVVGPHMAALGVRVAGTLRGKPDRKQGGIKDWATYRSEIVRLGRTSSHHYVATLVDFYAMPASWPGRTEANGKAIVQRGAHVEAALRADLVSDLANRFIPCVQLHEFEALLFVAPTAAVGSLRASAPDLTNLQLAAAQMAAVTTRCGGTVEHIDDSPETAPSKRLKAIFNRYDKVAWGVLAAKNVTLPVLRKGCAWLDRWVCSLEKISTPTITK